MWCTQLAENTGRKKVAKNRHLCTIAQLCRAIPLQLRHVSTIGKKLFKQQYVLQMSPQYGELRSTSGWGRFVSLGGNWTTRGYANSRTGHLTDWSTRGLDNSRTSQLADWTSHGLDNSRSRRCRQKGKLHMQSRRWHPRVVQFATCPVRELSSPRVDQSARCPVRKSSSPRVGNPRVGVSAKGVLCMRWTQRSFQLVMAAYLIGGPLYFCPVISFYLSFFIFLA